MLRGAKRHDVWVTPSLAWIRLEISLSNDQKKENAEEGHKFYCNNTPGPRLGQTIRTDGSAGGGAAWAAGKKATQI